jgi:hypothetical protein
VIFAKTLHGTGLHSTAIFGSFFPSKKIKSTQKPKHKPMKKLIYIAILCIITAMSASSCTEQEVKPRDGGGGGALPPDPKG